MTSEEYIRLVARLNGAEAPLDLLEPVLRAAIALDGYLRAEDDKLAYADPPVHAVEAPIFFAEIYFAQLRAFEAALLDLASKDRFASSARAAADAYAETFSTAATRAEQRFVMVGEEAITTSGVYGNFVIPFSAEGVQTLERAATAAVDALPARVRHQEAS